MTNLLIRSCLLQRSISSFRPVAGARGRLVLSQAKTHGRQPGLRGGGEHAAVLRLHDVGLQRWPSDEEALIAGTFISCQSCRCRCRVPFDLLKSILQKTKKTHGFWPFDGPRPESSEAAYAQQWPYSWIFSIAVLHHLHCGGHIHYGGLHNSWASD